MSAPDAVHPEQLTRIADRFDISRPPLEIAPLGHGLINSTFRVETAHGRYVLQRINGHVFPHPERIMANLRRLCEQVESGADSSPRIPAIIRTREGDSATRDAAGNLWRMLELIPDAQGLARIETHGQAREVGRLLGGFHRATSGLGIEDFQVSLPGFHETPTYLEQLHALSAHPASGAHEATTQQLLDFIDAHQGLAGVLDAAYRSGRIARQITHGDPKLDNILFSADGTRALALIDLDTVQPGLIQHDLGDCLRSCCNRGGEGTPDPAATRFDLKVCEGILSGYAELMRERLHPNDIALIYDAIRLIPLELGIRFLTDHLNGDPYFRVEYPGQNRLKAKIQFALVADIERQEDRLRAMIDSIF